MAIKNKFGFTLIELIIVIAILGIFAAGFLAVLNPVSQFNKANDLRKKADLSQIQKSLESYYQDNGRYPPKATQCSNQILGNNGDGNDCIEWGKPWQPYMNVIPKDPNTGRNYVYFVPTDGQSYYLYASLNRGSDDSQACHADGSVCSSVSSNGLSSTSCGGTCNFGLASPNVSP